MAGSLFILPRTSPLHSGAVLPSSLLYFYKTGTTTAQNTYSDSALTTPNANPVVADAEGNFGKIYLDPSTGFDYRVTWKTSAGVQVWQEDDIASNTVSANYRVSGTTPEYIFDETDASSGNRKWRIRVNSEQMVVSVGNDAESVWVDAITIDRTANVVDTINLAATTVQGNSTLLTKSSTGSFTPTWSGFGTPPTGDISYELFTGSLGRMVALYFPATNIAVSNATSMSLTGLPSAIRAATDTNPRFPCILHDNSVYAAGAFGFGTPAGKLVFYKGVDSAGFTNVNNKGLPPLATLIYAF